MNTKKFRLSTKNLFLTYPQINPDFTKEEILFQLSHNVGKKIINYIICIEKHEDGGTHAHAVLQLDQRCDIKNSNRLDLVFKDITYHGNYLRCKSLREAVKYVAKSKDYITNYSINEDGNFINFYETLFKISQERGLNEALDFFAEKEPSLIARRYTSIKSNLKARLSDMKEQRNQMRTFSIDDYEPHSEIDQSFSKDVKKSIWISGPSGSRKTQYVTAKAKSLVELNELKNFIFVRHLDQLKGFNADIHELIIIDDCLLPKCREELISLFDVEAPGAINVKYDVITIPANIRKIFISNTTFEEMLKQRKLSGDMALINRVKIIKIKEKISLKYTLELEIESESETAADS